MRLFNRATAATAILTALSTFAPAQPPSSGVIGGGSTFVNPAMTRWASEFNKVTGIQVNYQSVGSGGGIRQLVAKTLDFGATDAPMTPEQLGEAGGPVIHVPVIMGAVVVIYNIPEITKPLILSGPVLAQIYMGKISKWNDKAIADLNPGAPLPDQPINLVRRADSSGTTYTFADFLAKVSPDWKSAMGISTTVNWPAGSVGGKGNEGVAAQVQQLNYSIGYVELIYATKGNLAHAQIVNAAGKSVTATPESVTAAGADLKEIPADLRMSITNAPGAAAYPIAGITWIIARPTTEKAGKGPVIRQFVDYVLSEAGQASASSIQYSKLPASLLEKAKAAAKQIQ